MNAIGAINNLDYKAYKKLWAEFWVQKIGYNPAEKEMTARKMSLEEARKEDEELEYEFEKFHKNKISK